MFLILSFIPGERDRWDPSRDDLRIWRPRQLQRWMRRHDHFLPTLVRLCRDQTIKGRTKDLQNVQYCNTILCDTLMIILLYPSLPKCRKNYLLPVSGTSVGLIILLICSIDCKSGLKPPWQQNIFSSTIAAIGKQLKQSVKVFHSLMLNRRLPEICCKQNNWNSQQCKFVGLY